MADLQTHLDRFVAVAEDLDEINAAGSEYPDTDNDPLTMYLPFAFIDDGEATYERLNSDMWRVTREVISLVYVKEYEPESITEETLARQMARELLPVYVGQFLKRSRLQLNDQGLNSLNNATVAADSGTTSAGRRNRMYMCLYVRHSITYDEQITEV